MVDCIIKHRIGGHLGRYDYLGRVKAAFVTESCLRELGVLWRHQQELKMFWFKNQSELYQKGFLRKLRSYNVRGKVFAQVNGRLKDRIKGRSRSVLN